MSRVDSPTLLADLRSFAEHVRDFKAKRLRPSSRSFRPEFSGKIKGKRTALFEADYVHGRVVTALAAEVQRHGFSVERNRAEDLVAVDSKGRVRALFEVKTSVQPYCIYTGIGQLLFHGLQHQPDCRRFLVLPSTPKEGTRRVLRSLDLTPLRYDSTKKTILVLGVKQALSSK